MDKVPCGNGAADLLRPYITEAVRRGNPVLTAFVLHVEQTWKAEDMSASFFLYNELTAGKQAWQKKIETY